MTQLSCQTSQTSLSRRSLLRSAGAAAVVCASPMPWAQAPSEWRLMINEGVNVDLSISMLATRYRSWADYMGTQIRNKQVVVDPIIDIRRFVQQAMGESKPLVIYGKSVNQVAKLVRDHGYHPLVRRPEPYQAAFIVPKGSNISNFSQFAGRKLLMPDEYAGTTAVAKAELRRVGVREPFISHTRFQETVIVQINLGQADVGVVSPTMAKKWRDAGGRVIAETQPVVNHTVLASPKASPEMVAKLTESLLAMNGQAGLLGDIGVKQWAKAEKAEYMALLDYLGE